MDGASPVAPSEALWELLDRETDGLTDEGLVHERHAVAAFGLPFECVLIPSRADRAGTPSAERPAFGVHSADRIRRKEAFWRSETLIATPNRFPFFAPQALLWPAHESPREPSTGFLAACFDVAEGTGASVLFNSIGASASIPVAHGHLMRRESPVLGRVELELVERVAGAEVLTPTGNFPLFAAVVHAANAQRRADLVIGLLAARRHAAFNVLAERDLAWVFPRTLEVAAAHFPFAIGAGELWGRFVYPDRDSFAEATSTRLESALKSAVPVARSAQREGLCRLLSKDDQS
ncbi:MAG: hypothetical protein QGG14_07765 [Planctomycetota bacterium]|nr:hypothetical protein [Planctomycetota bacterium]